MVIGYFKNTVEQEAGRKSVRLREGQKTGRGRKNFWKDRARKGVGILIYKLRTRQ